MPSTFKTLILALLITFSFLAVSKVVNAGSADFKYKKNSKIIASTLYCSYELSSGDYHWNEFILELTELKNNNETKELNIDVFTADLWYVEFFRGADKYFITHGYKYFYKDSYYIRLFGGLSMFPDSKIMINRKSLDLKHTVKDSWGVTERNYSCELFEKSGREGAFNKLTALKSIYEDTKIKENKENKI